LRLLWLFRFPDRLLLGGFGGFGLGAILEVVTGVFALEFFHASCGVDESLLAGKVWVRSGPYFDVQFRDGGTNGHNVLAVVEDLAVGEITRMNSGFHGLPVPNSG